MTAPSDALFSCTKLKLATGPQPAILLDQTINDMLAYWRENLIPRCSVSRKLEVLSKNFTAIRPNIRSAPGP